MWGRLEMTLPIVWALVAIIQVALQAVLLRPIFRPTELWNPYFRTVSGSEVLLIRQPHWYVPLPLWLLRWEFIRNFCFDSFDLEFAWGLHLLLLLRLFFGSRLLIPHPRHKMFTEADHFLTLELIICDLLVVGPKNGFTILGFLCRQPSWLLFLDLSLLLLGFLRRRKFELAILHSVNFSFVPFCRLFFALINPLFLELNLLLGQLLDFRLYNGTDSLGDRVRFILVNIPCTRGESPHFSGKQSLLGLSVFLLLFRCLPLFGNCLVETVFNTRFAT